MKPTMPEPPDHLAPATADWWRTIVGEYVLESHHLKILESAAACWDRAEAARQDVATNGLTFVDKHGQPRANPSVSIERDARAAFLRHLRELALDVDAPATQHESRPPMRTGKSHLRVAKG